MKVEYASNAETHHTQSPLTSNASPTSTKQPKVSMFGSKTGFVIPKNKLSGSLVPIFRDTKKPRGSDQTNEVSTKQVKRKTKWGPDLTQDSFLRKGRAVAYQTRVDQITEQLKLRNLETEENHASILAATGADEESLTQEIDFQKPEQLEHERREVIGEILKLNPNYRTTPDYKPLLKETRVHVPVKEYPQYNFLGIIFGSGSDTQKRLEKETGAKIQVFGSKRDSTEKVEILSDEKDNQDAYHEIYVLISAETYDKVDAAVSLIDMLVTPVSGRQAVLPPAVSGNKIDVIAPSQDVGSSIMTTSSPTNQIIEQQHLGPNQTTSQGQFQYTNPWFPTGPHNTLQSPSSFTSPNPTAYALNSHSLHSPSPSNMPTPHGLPATEAAFVLAISNPSVISSRPQPQMELLHQPSAYMSGQMGPPRYPPMPTPQQLPAQPIILQPHQSSGNHSTPMFPTSPRRPFMSSLPQPVPELPPGPLHSAPSTHAGSSGGWSGLLTARSAPQFSSNMDRPSLPLVLTPQVGASQASGAALLPPQASVSPALLPIQSYNEIPMQRSFPRAPVPIPYFSPVPGSGPISSVLPGLGSGNTPNFTSMRAPASTAPRPQVPLAGDFTFQPQHPQQSCSPMNNWPDGHPLARGPASQPHFTPKIQSFGSGMPNPAPQPFVSDLPRPQFGNQITHTQPHFSIRNPSMPNPSRFPVFPNLNSTTPTPTGPRNFIPLHQRPNLSSPFPRPGNDMQFQQNYSSRGPIQGHFPAPNQFQNSMTFPSGRPAVRPSGGQQVYDPFSPTSSSLVHQQQIGNLGNMRKQENDPEYEDLMSSVGVK